MTAPARAFQHATGTKKKKEKNEKKSGGGGLGGGITHTPLALRVKQGGQQRHETALTQIYSNQLNAITLPVLPQACWKSECEPTPLRV